MKRDFKKVMLYVKRDLCGVGGRSVGGYIKSPINKNIYDMTPVKETYMYVIGDLLE